MRHTNSAGPIDRRAFGRALGAGALLAPGLGAQAPATRPALKPAGFVKAAFFYPPTAQLDAEGYYSWPGKTFDAEGRQTQYTTTLRRLAAELGLRIDIEPAPVDTPNQLSRFISAVQSESPDGLLLILFKKSHVENIYKVLDAIRLPSVVFATLGILLNPMIRQLDGYAHAYRVNSLENLEAVRLGLKMIQTLRRMKDATLVDITNRSRADQRVSHLGTRVVTVPLQDFYDLFAAIGRTSEVNERARRYLREAVKRVEPDENDVYEAAKCYFVLKQIIEREKADAVMMTCLPGLRRPRRHVPPCMGFMDLRDEAIPAGCQSDLDATLTMMLLQYLFDRPSFQHNPSSDTEKNLYFGAHCTAPARMNGPEQSAERYALRSHAEAGWGCVPQVFFPVGRRVTLANYFSRENPPQMSIYSGTLVGCPPNPPCGGCRTNMLVRVDGCADPSQLKSGDHLCMCYGEHAAHLRAFCRLAGVTATA